jgi:uncharacterized protein YecT (DUF1311 family)
MRFLVPAALSVAAMAAAAAGAQAWDWSTANDELSSGPGYAASKSICRQVRGREPPAADAPDAATAAALKGCNSEDLYYGIRVKADPAKARQCAFLEISEKRDDSAFSGRAMLMMAYANGLGAKRDLDVAIHLACGIEGAPMESDGRVRHLAELKAKGWTGRDFDFCDDITSGYAMGLCASRDADIKGAKRDSELAALTRGWTAAELQAWTTLKKAHQGFVDAHSENEIDLSGTARGAMAVAEDEALKDELLAMLKALQAGKAPRLSAADYKAADDALNAAYRRFLASDTVGGDYPGAVTRQGVRDAQRAWLRYRDAFASFVAIKYPGTGRDAAAAWVTQNRTRMFEQGGSMVSE